MIAVASQGEEEKLSCIPAPSTKDTTVKPVLFQSNEQTIILIDHQVIILLDRQVRDAYLAFFP